MGGKHRKTHSTSSADLDFPSVGDCFTGSLTSSATVTEGTAAVFTVTGTAGTVVPYTITTTGAGNVSTADFVAGQAFTGNITIGAGGTGTVALTPINDGVTEALENLTMVLTPNAALYTLSGTGSATTTVSDLVGLATPLAVAVTAANTLPVTGLAGDATLGNVTYTVGQIQVISATG
jgi:hypothetical protein